MGVLGTCVAVIATAVSVVVLPGCLRPSLEVNVRGYVAEGWETVEDVFRRQVESGQQRGGSFSVYHRGRRVVNLVGGYADPEAKNPWTEDTISPFFSSTKGVAALVIAKLADRGLLDYGSPVMTYWPEFGAQGKEEITVEQLLSHQAGLAVIEEEFTLDDIRYNTPRLSHVLANQKPHWSPGEAVGYHALSLGLYQDQLVRRVDPQQRSLSQFFKEEFAGPLGLDFQIGLPVRENYRCTRIMLPGLWDLLKDVYYHPEVLQIGLNLLNPDSFIWGAIKPREVLLYNQHAFRELPIPSSNGYGTAESLAKLYGIIANGSLHQGAPVYTPDMLNLLDDVIISGTDLVVAGVNITYGRGFSILPNADKSGWTFGTPGVGGQMAYGDLRHRLGWAYLSNFPAATVIGSDTHTELWEAMYRAVRDQEGGTG